MRGSRHSLFVIGAIAIIAMALSHAFTIGYGVGTERRAKTMLAAQQAKLHTPSHLTIHYERQINGQEDILRLEIDTTYRSIGKGAFRYEVICDRTVSLYGSADEVFTADEAKRCFIYSSERRWNELHRHQSIEGYDCWAAATADNTWQAWYTTQLPHCLADATTTDGLKGLILQVESKARGYRLRALQIEERIG